MIEYSIIGAIVAAYAVTIVVRWRRTTARIHASQEAWDRWSEIDAEHHRHVVLGIMAAVDGKTASSEWHRRVCDHLDRQREVAREEKDRTLAVMVGGEQTHRRPRKHAETKSST